MTPRRAWLRIAKGAVVAFVVGAIAGLVAQLQSNSGQAVGYPLSLPRMVVPSGTERFGRDNFLPGSSPAAAPPASGVIPAPDWMILRAKTRPTTREL
jgi:hypothetical protein